ncbi:MAG: protease HtpX [Buchnera aphidicola (Periphyllus acericola)]|uniref:protease HtpX n=1 Tax=Buchnera aphidicola TaxID=9 RepID=UPI0030CD04CA|nr:protease HtpX [Buchnera aphidicola (Periphyllus acericola)]
MIRILLFLLTNLAVISILCILSFFIDIQNKNFLLFLLSTTLFGFGGSFLSLLLSKKIALFSINSKVIKTPKNLREKWLLNIVKKQANQLKIKIPDLTIYKSKNINAFATGATKNSSLVALSEKLLNNMNENEIKAVIAHEMTHISNGDMVTMTLIQGITNTFVIFISRVISNFISHIFNNSENTNWFLKKNKFINLIITLFLEILFGTLSGIIVMWFSRYREFYADAGSAKLVGKKNMISALISIKNNISTSTKHENLSTLYINNKNKCVSYLFMSHPTIKNRIKALMKETYM